METLEPGSPNGYIPRLDYRNGAILNMIDILSLLYFTEEHQLQP